ncbi:MAG: HlyC/CorC family transporter [Acidobacteria bacterium]|nr:HlyC/CorC family transporter [Acidobacteriota bacterium]
MTILLLIAMFAFSLLVICVSFVHLLCRESLRIKARELASIEFYRETLQDRLGMEAEHGALVFSLVRHFGLLALAIVAMAITLMGDSPLWRAVLEAFGLSSLLMLATSYVAPRFLYRNTSGKWVMALLPLLRLAAIVSRPIIATLEFIQSLADLGDQTAGQEQEATPEEHIEALIEAGKEEGILEESDERLIQSVVAFGDKTVREVMTARPNIVAIAADRTLEELRNLVINEQYSRVPVYEGAIDNLIGFVHVRDMFELDAGQRSARLVKSMIRPLHIVPESKPVRDLLREMQRDSVHMAGVVDEYGNTAGIATMEDLVEEILGEIRDEHEPGVDAVPDADGAYLVAGNFDLDNLKHLLDFTPEEETEATTVGGLVTEWLGYVPRSGEAVEREGIRIEVMASDERRVERLRVRKAVNA